jgi:hypothetical protein
MMGINLFLNHSIKNTKSESKLIKDVKILDAKGFGKIHRFIDGAIDLKSSDSKEIENNNVYSSLLNLRTKLELGDFDYILKYEEELYQEITKLRIEKESQKREQERKKNKKNL